MIKTDMGGKKGKKRKKFPSYYTRENDVSRIMSEHRDYVNSILGSKNGIWDCFGALEWTMEVFKRQRSFSLEIL